MPAGESLISRAGAIAGSVAILTSAALPRSIAAAARGWSGWEDLGGISTSGPAVSSWASNRLDVFTRGTNNHMWHKWYDRTWSGWEDLGGQFVDNPAAASWGSSRIDTFVRGTDNRMYHKWYS
jgi:hypothetical protein